MKHFPVVLSALSVFPHSAAKAVTLAHAHGFDGVELFLDRHTLRRLPACLKQADEHGLRQTLHQCWSYDEHPSWESRVLQVLGFTLPTGYRLDRHLSPASQIPIVVYADRGLETLALPHTCWWQTISARSGGRYRLPYAQFVEQVREHKAGVVFDTQHVLEYVLGRSGVEHLSSRPTILMRQLERAWLELGPYVREIHFNDCDPHLGRNLFPGMGRMPLQGFSALVRSTGWRGVIVPEVSPRWLLHKRPALTRLRTTVEAFWND